jgi:hypothetical protein
MKCEGVISVQLLVLRRIRERRESRDPKLHIDAPQKNF